MNKKHGLVATAWMLGGGLLLNTSLVEAQLAAPAEEYFAPQRSAPFSPKKAPGLLPEMLRNADASTKSTIAPSDSLSAGHKINGVPVAPKRSSKIVKITPANHQIEGANTTANQGDSAPSPIQKQLEEMYRKDGRPMPQMNFSQTPIPANGQVSNANPIAGNPSNAASTNVVLPKRSLLSKLNPFSRSKSAPAQLPRHPANPIPKMATVPPQLQPGLAPGANGIKPAGANTSNGFDNSAPRALPVPPSAIPSPQSAAAQGSSQLSDSLPPVPGDAGYQAPAASDAVVVPPAPASNDTELDNVFNDKPDENVESQAKQPAEPKASEEDNPFSGLSLDEEFGPASKPDSAKATTEEPITESDSAKATTDEPMTESDSKESATNEPKTESDSKDSQPAAASEINPGKIPLPPKALPAEPAKDEIDAKMKLISERGELRGLKGFCPVALRDDRELKNALPEHHSTFKGRTFYFSTADAKADFDEHPQHYAPISGGQDVVLLAEKVTKEGSLDHAVWFKGRLYLFTSQKTLEQFVATPKEFAISE